MSNVCERGFTYGRRKCDAASVHQKILNAERRRQKKPKTKVCRKGKEGEKEGGRY